MSGCVFVRLFPISISSTEMIVTMIRTVAQMKGQSKFVSEPLT